MIARSLRVAANESSATATVVVLSEDGVVGRALELLLRTTDYSVRFLADPSSLDPRLFEEVQLLLLTPGSNAERREAFEIVKSAPDAARISILELVTDAREAQVGSGNYLTWPCRTEELKRQINTLLVGFEASEAIQNPRTHERHKR
jgi:hypothetical protein